MTKHYDSNNIFAKIIRGEIPCNKVFEDENTLAFHDISKAAPTHILVIPKGEYVDFDDFVSNARPEEFSNFFKTVRDIASANGVSQSGYRLITNKGTEASQTVKHFHIHILGGRALGGLLPNDKLNR